MLIERRGFLGSILALATPPGFVHAGVLMPVKTPLHILWADGFRCDSDALKAWLCGGRVLFADGARPGRALDGLRFMLKKPIVITGDVDAGGRAITHCHFHLDHRHPLFMTDAAKHVGVYSVELQ